MLNNVVGRAVLLQEGNREVCVCGDVCVAHLKCVWVCGWVWEAIEAAVAAGCWDRENSEDTLFLCQDQSLRGTKQIQKRGAKCGNMKGWEGERWYLNFFLPTKSLQNSRWWFHEFYLFFQKNEVFQSAMSCSTKCTFLKIKRRKRFISVYPVLCTQ